MRNSSDSTGQKRFALFRMLAYGSSAGSVLEQIRLSRLKHLEYMGKIFQTVAENHEEQFLRLPNGKEANIIAEEYAHLLFPVFLVLLDFASWEWDVFPFSWKGMCK